MAGRPKIPSKDRKKNTLRVRLTDQEHAILVTAAENAGVTVSEWVRSLALASAEDQLKEPIKPKVD